MNEDIAKNLIQKALQNSFNKEQFVYLIKNILKHIDDAHFVYKGNLIFDDFADSVESLERIGKYKDPEGKEIDILIVHLIRETSLERARTKQRNFIAKYLKGSRGGVLRDAALVAFVSPNNDDWRFSLVKMEYKFNEKGKVEEEFTPARRHSFLVGKNENSHTAQSRLLPLLLNDEASPTLADLEEVFSVERVTEEFFEKYRELFLRLKESLDDIVKKNPKVEADFKEKNVDTVDFAKKLLGQIVFLYFLQKKGWFGVKRDSQWGTGSKQFLRELFEGKHCTYDNFFNDILEPLFYEALRIDRRHDDDYYSRFNCKIPFLNGGLFDPIGNYDWVHSDILIPNELFSNNNKTKDGDTGDGILDVFDRYNFTVKEDEPLEKEVAIDPEMLGKVFENLLEIKDRKSKGTYYTPPEIVHYMCQESLANYLATELDGKVSKEDIETLIKYGEAVIEHDETYLEKTTNNENYKGRYDKAKLPESIRKHAKLIDEKLALIRVCDPAVGSGAFLVGMMHEIIRARNALTPYIGRNDERTSYNFKREAIQNNLYGVDIDPGAVEIAKLRLWLSLIVDEEDRAKVQPLPNLDYKIVQGNSLLGVEKGLFNADLFNKLEKLKPLYFNETNASKKQDYRKQIDELIIQITNGHTEFDFEVYFSEVFHEKGGFDVVIGNPPYGADLNKNEKKTLDSRYNEWRSSTKNSAIYFIYVADDICQVNGVNSFIVPKSLCYSLGWNSCASFLFPTLQKLIDSGKAFEFVKLEQVIFVKQKVKQQGFYVTGLYDGNEVLELGEVSKDIFHNRRVLLAGQYPKELAVIKKIINSFKARWEDYVSIERGLNWQSKVAKFPGATPIYRGAQLFPYHLDKATDFVDISKFDKREYAYLLRPKILNQLAIAHVQNPYPHFFLQAALDMDYNLVYETISCTFVTDQRVDIRFLLGINNSKLFAWLLYKFIYSNAIRSTRYDAQYVGRIPTPNFENIDQKPLIDLVDKILAITKDDDYLENSAKQAKVHEYEKQIDQLVYKLYGLTDEEIKIVEGEK
ncbi:MAG: Eco57I restriction-modification methylase domain-containing protein [Thermoflavifilum sp.]|nr:Eco57I restriction-modification methylase domain-containing protein [Thermoflavifilum sp.]